MLLLIVGLWVVTIGLFLSGTQGIEVKGRGASATIDLHDRHREPTFSLGQGLGLAVFSDHPIRGTIVELAPAPLLCRPCGAMTDHGDLGQVTHRNGDWFYHGPEETNVNLKGLDDETSSAFRTVAYNVATKERAMVSAALGKDEQARTLAAHGLVVDGAHAITPAMLGAMPAISMLEENCVVFNVAFLFVIALWTMIGGPIALLRKRTR